MNRTGGFDTSAGLGEVTEEVVWRKLRALRPARSRVPPPRRASIRGNELRFAVEEVVRCGNVGDDDLRGDHLARSQRRVTVGETYARDRGLVEHDAEER